MQASQTTTNTTERGGASRQQRLLFRFLPIVGVMVLIGFLEGWPPTTWVYLFHVYTQWETLWSQQQTALLLPVFVLALQSILLLVAWGLCLWLAFRELKAFIGSNQQQAVAPLTPYHQGVHIAPPQAVYNAPNQPQVYAQHQPYLQAQSQQPFPGSGVQQPIQAHQQPPVPMPYPAAQQPVQPHWHPAQAQQAFKTQQPVQHLQLPRGNSGTQPPLVAPAMQTPPIQGQAHTSSPEMPLTTPILPIDSSIPTPQIGSQETPDQFPDNPFEDSENTHQPTMQLQALTLPKQELATLPELDEETTLTVIQDVEAAPDEEAIETPFDVDEETGKRQIVAGNNLQKKPFQPGDAQQQAKVLRELGFYQATPEPEKVESGSVLGEAALEVAMNQPTDKEPIQPTRAPQHTANNPFDVQSDLIDLFQEESTIEEESTSDSSLSEEEEESPFVFGNPFEGPIPDVFHHDNVLKKVLQESQQSNEKKRNDEKK
ncbi:hypothetical protein [Ktedonospora formicarum]|uniref:Uncharacterized protein n=1 Tax=Ktedonospora formicarum TaxID=2778364 RepID=A0A8J3HZI7_9CHLR|nr:hypothetical protein [Ktedonospora formicarum]GHO42799.1 hypothetical protein KSX_09620 [Ktedonospora formicarum]